MALIKLIKSRSYTDGQITVKSEKPVIEVPDAEAQRYIDTGFFAATDGTAEAGGKAPEVTDTKELDELLFPGDEMEPEPTVEEQIIAELEHKTVKELKAYAQAKGIDLADASKKDAIIPIIVAAEQRAAEAREALRQE